MFQTETDLAATSEEAQQIQEQVHKVQIQGEGTHDADLHEQAAVFSKRRIRCPTLDLLGVISGEDGEDENTRQADDEIQA